MAGVLPVCTGFACRGGSGFRRCFRLRRNRSTVRLGLFLGLGGICSSLFFRLCDDLAGRLGSFVPDLLYDFF